MAFVRGVGAEDEWAGEEGWKGLPVLDLAEVMGCSRETIRGHINRLDSEGQIETQVHNRQHDASTEMTGGHGWSSRDEPPKPWAAAPRGGRRAEIARHGVVPANKRLSRSSSL